MNKKLYIFTIALGIISNSVFADNHPFLNSTFKIKKDLPLNLISRSQSDFIAKVDKESSDVKDRKFVFVDGKPITGFTSIGEFEKKCELYIRDGIKVEKAILKSEVNATCKINKSIPTRAAKVFSFIEMNFNDSCMFSKMVCSENVIVQSIMRMKEENIQYQVHEYFDFLKTDTETKSQKISDAKIKNKTEKMNVNKPDISTKSLAH